MRFLYLLTLFICIGQLSAQSLPNPSFEEWEGEEIFFKPSSWRYISTIISFGYCVNDEFPLERSESTPFGNYAAKLTTKLCYFQTGSSFNMSGLLSLKESGLIYTLDGMYYSERPTYMQFAYHFLPQGNDTAFARVQLYTIHIPEGDTLPEEHKLVGEGTLDIIQGTSGYETAIIPIEYFLPDTPDIQQIEFTSYKNLTPTGYIDILNDVSNTHADTGTVLYIDAVSLSSFPVGNSQSYLLKDGGISVYPNPISTELNIQIPQQGTYQVQLINSEGKRVYSNSKTIESYSKLQVNTSHFPKGIYFLSIQGEGLDYQETVIKQ